MKRRITPLTWALAPEWLTLAEAAELPSYTMVRLRRLSRRIPIERVTVPGTWRSRLSSARHLPLTPIESLPSSLSQKDKPQRAQMQKTCSAWQ